MVRELKTMLPGDLLSLRQAAGAAIEALAWLDLMIDDVKGLRQAGAEWSAAAEVLRKTDAELKRRRIHGPVAPVGKRRAH